MFLLVPTCVGYKEGGGGLRNSGGKHNGGFSFDLSAVHNCLSEYVVDYGR